MVTHETREQWLHAFAAEARAMFAGHGYTVPDNVKLTCGFPSTAALSRKKRRIGECWDARVSAGNVFEIFIHPMIAEPGEVAAISAHEIVHATVGLEHGHKAPFAKCAKAIGLEGKMTATVAGAAFKAWFASLADKLGEYPHATLRASNSAKKQKTRMLKVACPHCESEGEPYIARMSASTIERGTPLCPVHGEPMEVV